MTTNIAWHEDNYRFIVPEIHDNYNVMACKIYLSDKTTWLLGLRM